MSNSPIMSRLIVHGFTISLASSIYPAFKAPTTL